MKKLPQTVYVYWEDEDDPFLLAYEEIERTADLDESHLVGVYELKAQATVTAEVKTTIVPAKSRRSK